MWVTPRPGEVTYLNAVYYQALLDAVDLASRLGYGCQSLKHCATSSRENVGFPPITAARYRATTAESRAGAEPT